MTKPELLVTAGTMEEMERLIDAGADAVQLGEQRYGMRLPGDFDLPVLEQAVRLAHSKQAKVYVVANNIMNNDVLPELPAYVKEVARIGADALVFGDPAVLMALKQAGVEIPLHWNPEMTATNYVTANYWAGKGATRVILARELNLEEVLAFKQNVKMEVQVQVHGMTNIFHSKREMVSNYLKHQGLAPNPSDHGKDQGLFLIEVERQEEKYPVYEDCNGTHIMSSDDICMLEDLHELLAAGIDSFKIEGLLKPLEYNVTAVRAYRQAIDAYAADPSAYEFNPEWLEAIEKIQPAGRELSFGFFYKEQVY